MQGVSNTEKLIASAKAVASSTAQLLVACRVKADADSENSRRLHVRENSPEGGAGFIIIWGVCIGGRFCG